MSGKTTTRIGLRGRRTNDMALPKDRQSAKGHNQPAAGRLNGPGRRHAEVPWVLDTEIHHT
ncbi:hypothetical protein [Sinorhizobium arboris]|uniref:hypothetical protein n=1 Tax=Sinorhizobium arboris TaxID=76745 RepID=UPI0005199B1A|nr:hypothetical protein [Sinorhizobium arboris]